MPIVNGTYVYQNLGSDQQNIQKQAFGSDWKPTKKDMSDYSAAAYNYMMKQQEQAYNLELWNLMNEYNSPALQMSRYADAGLNPNLIYSQQNTASVPASASAPTFRSGGTYAKGMQTGLEAIGQVMNMVKAAADTYDYWKYGRTGSALSNQSLKLGNDMSEWRTRLLSQQETAQYLQNQWNMWLQGRMDFDETAPAVKMYRTQQEAKSANIEQIRQLIDASLTGQSRTRALQELDSYRLKILQGQNDAVLNIHTGLGASFDGFLKAMIYLAMSKL